MKHYLIESWTEEHGTMFSTHWADDFDHAAEQCRAEMKDIWDEDEVEIVTIFSSETEITSETARI